MKEKLIILSDLWGRKKSDWTKEYFKRLSPTFEIQYYDCCELGEINTQIYQQEVLHQQFVNGGIELAANKLIALEKDRINILAFSVAGVIAWKAALNGLKVKSLFAVSSTRLRYETEKPNCKIKCLFGELDSYRPKAVWFDKLGVNYEIMDGEGHELYMDVGCSVKVVQEIT